jgi:hypothetical protein
MVTNNCNNTWIVASGVYIWVRLKASTVMYVEDLQLARRHGPVQTPAAGKIFKAQVSLRKEHVLLVWQMVHQLISIIIVLLKSYVRLGRLLHSCTVETLLHLMHFLFSLLGFKACALNLITLNLNIFTRQAGYRLPLNPGTDSWLVHPVTEIVSSHLGWMPKPDYTNLEERWLVTSVS